MARFATGGGVPPASAKPSNSADKVGLFLRLWHSTSRHSRSFAQRSVPLLAMLEVALFLRFPFAPTSVKMATAPISGAA